MNLVLAASYFAYEMPQRGVWAFVALIAVLLYAQLYYFQKRVVERFLGGQLGQQLTRSRVPMSRWLYAGLIGLALLLGVIALMQPVWVESQVSENSKGEGAWIHRPHDIIFLLDRSRSMTVTDTRSGRSRFDTGVDLIEETLSHLSGENIALYTFSTDVNETVPGTMDHLYLRLRLQATHPEKEEGSGTDFKKIIDSLSTRLSQLPEDRRVSIVLLSDGEDNRWALLDASNRSYYLEEIEKGVQSWKLDQWSLNTVGLGSPAGGHIPDYLFGGEEVQSALREGPLQSIAEAGGGSYYYANDYSAIQLGERLAELLKAPSKMEQRVQSSSSQGAPLMEQRYP